MLVKAWETKVFPTIRRRFRNEAERKSGLDQIKGALQLGKQSLNSSNLYIVNISIIGIQENEQNCMTTVDVD